MSPVAALMAGYHSTHGAYLTLVRGLFGDFDMEDLASKTGGDYAVVVMLIYLFIAVFILLSMFLTILGEGQAKFREAQEASGAKLESFGVESIMEGLRGMTSYIHRQNAAAASEAPPAERPRRRGMTSYATISALHQ